MSDTTGAFELDELHDIELEQLLEKARAAGASAKEYEEKKREILRQVWDRMYQHQARRVTWDHGWSASIRQPVARLSRIALLENGVPATTIERSTVVPRDAQPFIQMSPPRSKGIKAVDGVEPTARPDSSAVLPPGVRS